MLKCVLWGTGEVFQKNIGCIKLHELMGEIKVVAITSKETAFKQILGYEFIKKEELPAIAFDILVVMADRKHYLSIIQEAEKLGISRKRIVHSEIFQRVNLNLEKYFLLKNNPPSIFANNCWGGVTYHSLDLPFLSPLINMSVHSDQDYLKLCQSPERYMRSPVELVTTKYNEELGREYPIGRCGDIELHFIHYTTFESAKENWEKRKKRINWDNLFIMMYTENEEIAEKFLELPYEKKICFVPFMTEESSLCYVNCFNPEKGMNEELWRKVNKMAARQLLYYDDVELLYQGKIRRIAEYI